MARKFKEIYSEEEFAKTSSKDDNGFYRKCSFFQVNYATGDQFRKTAILRSKDGPITLEQADQFYDGAKKEALEWLVDHPNESVDITITENEEGKQVAKTAPFKQLVCPRDFRTRIYDDNGNVVVGDANIRQEIKKKMERWEQLEREGKIKEVFHENHHFDSGKVFSITVRCGPEDERLHPNKINDETTWIPFEWMTDAVVNLFEDNDNKISWNEIPLLLGSSQSSENSGQKNTSTQEAKNSNQTQNDVNEPKLLNSDEIKNVSEEKLVALMEQINKELKNRREGNSNILWVSESSQELENKAQEIRDSLSRFQKNSNIHSIIPNKSNKIPVGGIALFALFSILTIGCLVLIKKRFAFRKNNRK
ncbi:MAG: hypothetical protein GBAus27B_000413 [Mycoplasmataceae bacterium]|nr:MAG: hypothetical protein GBAus27B_000413 [Mycoplasmataceae bacterium]